MPLEQALASQASFSGNAAETIVSSSRTARKPKSQAQPWKRQQIELKPSGRDLPKAERFGQHTKGRLPSGKTVK